jgi:hypothetical protein
MRSRQYSLPDLGDESGPCLRWEESVPLLTNRFVVYDIVKGTVLAGVILFITMTGIFALQGEPGLALEMLPIAGVALLVILTLLAVSALVVMGNRWHVRFSIDSVGVQWEQLRPPRTGLLAALATTAGHPTARGAAALRPAAAGGLLRWSAIHGVREHPGLRVISLMNRWRVLLRLYCDPSNYVQIASLARTQIDRHREKKGRNTR